jgi:hypothetical protein
VKCRQVVKQLEDALRSKEGKRLNSWSVGGDSAEKLDASLGAAKGDGRVIRDHKGPEARVLSCIFGKRG